MKLKTILTSFLISSLMVTNAFASINLTINSQTIKPDTPPSIVSGRTLVPVRAIFENLGVNIHWDDVTKTITGNSDNTTILLTLNSSTALVNGIEKQLDVPAQIINGRTMVPARFVAESLNCTVNWDAKTQTVSINTKDNTHEKVEEQIVTDDITTTNNSSTKIYITETGKKYHYDNNCNNGTYIESTLEDAKAKNLEPCNKCVK